MKKSYIIIAISSLAVGLIAMIAIGAVLFSPASREGISVEEEEIINRTGDMINTSDSQAIWAREIAARQLNLSDYVRIGLTGSSYLLKDRNDETFSRDLAYIAYGTVERSDEILQLLEGRSRNYVIEKVFSDMNRRYAPSQGFSAEKGTQLISFNAENPLQDEVGYVFGLRKISGTIDIDGNEARTDFFVDDTLRPGNLSLIQVPEGGQSFSMTWDARREDPGLHNVKVLLRTSDGRGKIITGGQVIVPNFTVITNDGVLSGKVAERENLSWYTLDAIDRDAFINFINPTGDIRVTLYNLYGEEIGSNDLHDFPHEILRGTRQAKLIGELALAGQDESFNVFYVRVERSPDAQVSLIDLNYTVVVSRNVAIHNDGRVLAVIDEMDAVPTPVPYHPVSPEDEATPILCSDENGNRSAFARADLDFLPLNGILTSMKVRSGDAGQTFRIYPDFDHQTRDYAYVSADEMSEISLDCLPAEGYAAKISMSNESQVTDLFPQGNNEPIRLLEGENVISVKVSSFDGTQTEYRIFVLNREDSDDFSETVLNHFPEGYRNGLWLMHSLFPEYRFEPYKTGIDWEDLISNQDNKGTSLADAYSHPQWVKSDSIVYDGAAWKAAKRQVVEYFLDPRNFLTPVTVFQFEKLSFDNTVHTAEGLSDMVRDSFLDSKDPDYPDILFNAGREAGISPYFLASRIIQEMGRNGHSKLASGTLEGYEGYFNYYNIGSTPNPEVQDGALINGARYAQWGRKPDERELTEEELALLLPWTSPELAIKGGALWIASSYVDIGQDTLYFQKFDVIDNEDGLFKHQYAQNISMAFSESSRYFSTYLSQDMLSSPFLFIIPIYENMPDYFGGIP
ncbi:MAG: cadherin-like beta sandwich domain-containing protein [Clostridiales bacterium]|nr:cadherin-like beta sandwich domain-containing protein [Clostridiales bacterium]